jgi:hypothetical protein
MTGRPKGKAHMSIKLVRITSVSFDITDQLQITSFAFVRY